MLTFAKDEKFTKYAKNREINFWQTFANDLTEFSTKNSIVGRFLTVTYNVKIAGIIPHTFFAKIS